MAWLRRPVVQLDVSLESGSAPRAMDIRSKPSGRVAIQPGRSIFDGQTFPDFLDPLVERVEAGMKASVLKVENKI